MSAVLSRRKFIKSSGIGIALTTSGLLPISSLSQHSSELKLNAYVQIRVDGSIIIAAPNPDVGQGIQTALPMIVAEELDADWSKVSVFNADIDANHYGFQFAGGSRSVPSRWNELRQMGAAARHMLVQAAANRLKTSPSGLITKSSTVLHLASGKKINYGDLAESAIEELIPDTETLSLKSPKQYQLLGRRIAQSTSSEILRGKPLFVIDSRLEGMVYATFVKCPQIGGVPIGANLEHILSLPGVITAFILPGTAGPPVFNISGEPTITPGIVIVARNTWSAFRARKQLRAEWDTTAASNDDTDAITLSALKASESGRGMTTIKAVGNPEAALREASYIHQASYQCDYISHAQLEPQSCLAKVRSESAEIWTSSQTPSAAKNAVAKLLGLKLTDVKIHSLRGGGGFGRRLSNEYVLEAAIIAKKMGKPVKLQWTREDDMAFDFFRSAAYYNLTAGVSSEGEIICWKNHVISGSADGEKANYGAGYSTKNFPDDIVPNIHITQTLINSKIPVGPWRAPISNTYAFAEQCFLYELSHLIGLDHKKFLLKSLGSDHWFTDGDNATLNTFRAKAVIQDVCDAASWGRLLPTGRGLGLAFYFSHAGHFAEVAEVSVNDRQQVRVHDVWVAADVGQVINLSGLENQIQGSVVDGLSALAAQKITLRNGVVEQTNFDQYPLLRIPQSPQIHVRLLNSGFAPTGAGEPALPPLAPAVCNAIHSACGKSIRSLPISEEGFYLA
mgnify:CR=1 FL=1